MYPHSIYYREHEKIVREIENFLELRSKGSAEEEGNDESDEETDRKSDLRDKKNK